MSHVLKGGWANSYVAPIVLARIPFGERGRAPASCADSVYLRCPASGPIHHTRLSGYPDDMARRDRQHSTGDTRAAMEGRAGLSPSEEEGAICRTRTACASTPTCAMKLDRWVVRGVREAIEDGCTWAQIGDALGTSRQGRPTSAMHP